MIEMYDFNSEELQNKILQDFTEKMKEYIEKNKDELVSDKNFTFRFELERSKKTTEKKAVYFTPTAYIKMMSLLYHYTSEVGWYGTAERMDDNYLVKDIYVYPQIVDGATVDTDQEKFEKWLDGLDEEVFNQLRFNGHSHVRMGTTPSSVDMEGRRSDLKMLRKDDFQIFMILNQEGDWTIDIYDRKDQKIYETEDIIIYVQNCAEDTFDFVDSTKDMVQKKSYISAFQKPTKKEAKQEKVTTPKRYLGEDYGYFKKAACDYGTYPHYDPEDYDFPY